ncbi:MAG TPA: hypothetical protein VEY51_15285 [Chondromyces sp.]|nr:hypothetical protein [Chondromyces sp.]
MEQKKVEEIHEEQKQSEFWGNQGLYYGIPSVIMLGLLILGVLGS